MSNPGDTVDDLTNLVEYLSLRTSLRAGSQPGREEQTDEIEPQGDAHGRGAPAGRSRSASHRGRVDRNCGRGRGRGETVPVIDQPDRLAPPRAVIVVNIPGRGAPAGRSRSQRERGGTDRGRGRGRGRGATVPEINQPDRLAPPRAVESLVVDTPSRGVPAGRSRSARERGGADRGRGRGRGRGAAMVTINQPEVPVPPQADDGRGRGRGRGRAERRPRATGRGGLRRGVDNGRMGSSNIGGIEGDSRGDEFSGRGGGHGETEGRSGQIPRPQSLVSVLPHMSNCCPSQTSRFRYGARGATWRD
ncbi:hypothetical protein B0H14DRAFT_2972145 [Mycena olivaceomarginata]|nr:hypothetical protein B0H14DRAFT_2972145 [Mycena olivaceomarginata]